MAIDATVGGIDSDSYVSVADADTYFLNHWSLAKSAAWTALSTGQKESVLKRACQILEGLRVLDDEYGDGPLPPALISIDIYDVNLHRLYSEQRLSFPRNIDTFSNDYSGYIPQTVKDAQCEQASYLLSVDETAMTATMTGLSEEWITAGSVSIRQKYNGMSGGGTLIAPQSFDLMRQYLRRTSRIRRA